MNGDFDDTNIHIDSKEKDAITVILNEYNNPSDMILWASWVETTTTSKKLHKKLMVVTHYRIFFFKKTLLGKKIDVDCVVHLLHLRSIVQLPSQTSLKFCFDGNNNIEISVVADLDKLKEVLKIVRENCQVITVGSKNSTNHLNIELTDTFDQSITVTPAQECDGYHQTYLAHCNMLGVSSSDSFILHTQCLQENCNHDMVLNDIPGVDYKSDLGPDLNSVILALRDNTWFDGLEAHNMKESNLFQWVGKILLTNITLCKVVLSDTDGSDLTSIGNAFAHNDNIGVNILDLSENSISRGIERFAEGLSAMKHGLQIINLRNCGISAKSMIMWIREIKKNPYHVAVLKELDLSGNNFGMNPGTLALSDLYNIDTNQCGLKCLRLSDTDISWETLMLGFHSLIYLEEFHMARCTVTEPDANAIALWLGKLQSLKKLNLSGLKITLPNLVTILRGIVSNSYLTDLTIDLSTFNIGNVLSNIKEFVEVLKDAKGITGINISDTGLKETAFHQVLDALPNIHVLQADRCCGDDPELTYYLTDYLECHPNLVVLSIAGSRKNYLQNASHFISSLATNTTLIELDFTHNFQYDSVAYSLSTALRKNTTLQSLAIDSDLISYAGWQCIFNGLRCNNTLCMIPVTHQNWGKISGVSKNISIKANKLMSEIKIHLYNNLKATPLFHVPLWVSTCQYDCDTPVDKATKLVDNIQ